MSVKETVGSWRVAVRVARRAAVRSKARTLLIVLMLALPVYAGTVLALSYTATYTSADTEASWWLGQADYKVDGQDRERLVATLPAGSETTEITYGRTVMRVGEDYGVLDYESLDLSSPLVRGAYVVRDGRAPRGAAEVAVSARLAEEDGLRIGDRLAVGLPPRERELVGIVDAARELSARVIVSPAGQPLSGSHPHTLIKLPPGGTDWAPWTVPVERVCEPTRSDGVCGANYGSLFRGDVRPTVTERATRSAALVLVVGFAGTQVALLAGAAFAIGARRQRRELAMIGAAGASHAQIARMVLANGLVLGAVAGVCGVALGALTYWLNRGRVERIANHALNDGAVPVLWLAAIALFAVAVGLLAASRRRFRPGPVSGSRRWPRRPGCGSRVRHRWFPRPRWRSAAPR